MAEDLLPLLGINIEEEGSSDSNEEELEAEEDGESDAPHASNITFDPNLPGCHSYLGNDLEDIRGRTVHQDDAYISIPILSLPGVVLIPGQTLPLHLFESNTVSMIRNVARNDHTFGIVLKRHREREIISESIGTTAEIFSMKEENDDRTGIMTVRVKAKGRQRFEVMETRRQSDGIQLAKVRILSERVLPDALEGAHPPSYRRICCCREDTDPLDPLRLDSGDHKLILQKWLTANRRKKNDRFKSAYMTWWPPWVYKQYDVYDLMHKVREELRWNDTLKPECMPRDPVDFSFWVAANLPLDDDMKLHLLRIDCAIQRLRCELSIVRRCTVLCCRECDQLIANKKDVFSMSLEGPMGAYVNPGGHVHEMMTVFKAQGLHDYGRASTENSWFPGYAWTIIECSSCHIHMGWKFTAVNRKLQPSRFWGLCRSSLLPGLQTDEEEEQGEDQENSSLKLLLY